MDMLHCRRCGYDIVIPDLSTEQKIALMHLYRTGKSVSVVKQLQKDTSLGLAQAKSVLDHMTPIQDTCCRCDYNLLPEGVSICPKCKSVNFNWRG